VTAYDTDVLAALPDGYWKLDEASGFSLADSSPHAHPLVGTGFVENYRVPGPSPGIPYALDFINLGTDPICATTTVGSYAIGQPFTVEGWWGGVGPMGTARSCLLTKGFGTAGEVRPWYMLGVDSTGQGLFWLRNVAGTDFKLAATGTLNDATYPQHGPFHHLVGTFDPTGTQAKLYIDGVPAVTMTVPNTGWGTGGQGLSSGIFNADKSNSWAAALAIYPSLFTPAGVLDHFTTGLSGNAFYPSQLSTTLTAQLADIAAILAAVRKTFPTT
jgi:Concanavalin A-like lectin/glucanases superfamily